MYTVTKKQFDFALRAQPQCTLHLLYYVYYVYSAQINLEISVYTTRIFYTVYTVKYAQCVCMQTVRVKYKHCVIYTDRVHTK